MTPDSPSPRHGPRALSRVDAGSAVLVTALLATVCKGLIAWHTSGTNDVAYWGRFAAGVREFGPLGIYGHPFDPVYNHPPLTGLLLVAINWLTAHGAGSIPFLIRLPACVADAVSTMLLFSLLKDRWSPSRAGLMAATVAWSPVAVVVSGYHGNTDSVVVMFALIAVHACARGRASIAGAALAVGVSVELVPVVLGPVLLLASLRSGRRPAARFATALAAVLLPLWAPAVLLRWSALREQVLGYPGIDTREWGVMQLLEWARAPAPVISTLSGPGRFAVLVVCAVLPCAMLLSARMTPVQASGLAMSTLLLLSPAFSMQYLVWPLAFCYLLAGSGAVTFNLVASSFVLDVYSHWSGGPPWQWQIASSRPFAPMGFVLMSLTWLALLNVVVIALRPGQTAAGPVDPPSIQELRAEPARPGIAQS